MSRKRKKNHDSVPFPDVEKKGEFLGIPILDEEIFEMSLAKRLGKIIIPKHYDVSFTYTMRKPFADSEEEVKEFNKISDTFEKDVVDLLSKMMEFCSDIDMEVKGK